MPDWLDGGYVGLVCGILIGLFAADVIDTWLVRRRAKNESKTKTKTK
jgi:hypothetical protein